MYLNRMPFAVPLKSHCLCRDAVAIICNSKPLSNYFCACIKAAEKGDPLVIFLLIFHHKSPNSVSLREYTGIGRQPHKPKQLQLPKIKMGFKSFKPLFAPKVCSRHKLSKWHVCEGFLPCLIWHRTTLFYDALTRLHILMSACECISLTMHKVQLCFCVPTCLWWAWPLCHWPCLYTASLNTCSQWKLSANTSMLFFHNKHWQVKWNDTAQ